jgi:hypothetical protein
MEDFDGNSNGSGVAGVRDDHDHGCGSDDALRRLRQLAKLRHSLGGNQDRTAPAERRWADRFRGLD